MVVYDARVGFEYQRVSVQVPVWLYDRLLACSEREYRSLSAEMVVRLEKSFTVTLGTVFEPVTVTEEGV